MTNYCELKIALGLTQKITHFLKLQNVVKSSLYKNKYFIQIFKLVTKVRFAKGSVESLQSTNMRRNVNKSKLGNYCPQIEDEMLTSWNFGTLQPVNMGWHVNKPKYGKV